MGIGDSCNLNVSGGKLIVNPENEEGGLVFIGKRRDLGGAVMNRVHCGELGNYIEASDWLTATVTGISWAVWSEVFKVSDSKAEASFLLRSGTPLTA